MRNFGLAVMFLLLTTGGFLFGLKTISSEEKILRDQLTAIETGNEREQTFNRLRNIAETSAADRTKLDQYFLPQVGESITFLSQVETLAPRNNITLKTDALEEGSDKKTKEKWVDAKFTFSGTRADVERFIQILENLPYVSRVTSVSLAARAQNNWEAQVSIRVYIANHEK